MQTFKVKKSSSVAEFKYDEASQELIVTYKNHSKYKIFDVPKNVFDSLCVAESTGKALNQVIRVEKRKYVKLAGQS